MISNFTNLRWANPEHTIIDCEMVSGSFGGVSLPYAASANDPEESCRAIFEEMLSGKYGDIAEYETPEPTEIAQPVVVASNPVDKLKAFLAANPDVAKILGT